MARIRYERLTLGQWQFVRYGAGIIGWSKEELRSFDRATRKMMTMNGALHPKGNVGRLCVPRAKGGRGLISCESCIRSKENSLGWYLKNTTEELVGVKTVVCIETDETASKREFRKRWTDEGLRKWKDKAMHVQFLSDMPESKDAEQTWNWHRSSDMKAQTEALICAAQEQALRTYYVKHHIDRTVVSPLCRICGEKEESVCHIVSECKTLTQKEYKRRHDIVTSIIHWKLCELHQLEGKVKWYSHVPEGVVENDEVKLLWDMAIQLDNVKARRPEIIVVDKTENKS